MPTMMPTTPLTSTGWVDVTARLDPATTPVYEGDAPVQFRFLKDMRRGDPVTLSALDLGAHSGTHVDAPLHFVSTGATIDQLTLDPFIGEAVVIEIPDSVQAITAAVLEQVEWRRAARVLFRTRSSLRGWMDSSTFHRDFAYIAPDAARLLAAARVRLVGIDDVEYASLLPVPLTTLRQPTLELGVVALSPMLTRVAHRELPARDIRLRCELVVRASCGTSPDRTTS